MSRARPAYVAPFVGEFVQMLSDVAEHAVIDMNNGYGGTDSIGIEISATDEMQAIRAALTGLPDAEWHKLPHSVREWAFGGPIKE